MTVSPKESTIDVDVRDVIFGADIQGNELHINGELDRKLYLRTNNVLEALGGKWSRKAKAHVFADDIDLEDLIAQVNETGTYIDPKANGFFETPADLADDVIALAEIEAGMRVLEPSAGRGALALKVAERASAADIDCIELLPANVRELSSFSFITTEGDFLSIAPSPEYDRVVMNPPFGKQAELDHVEHALRFLKPGGRLVAILPNSVVFRNDRRTTAFRSALESHAAYALSENVEGAFKASGTGVRTVTLVVDTKKEITTMDDSQINPEDEVQAEPVAAEDVSQIAPPKPKRGRPAGSKTKAATTEPGEVIVAAKPTKEPAAKPAAKKVKNGPTALGGVYDQLSESIAKAKDIKTAPLTGEALPTRSLMSLPIDEIVLDPRLQPRASIDQNTVKEYAEAMSNGDQFPPPVVFFDGQTHRLADGWHRIDASKLLLKDEVAVEVRPGTLRDAILFSSSVNYDHGLRRTSADKRRAVNRLLTDPEWTKMSDRQIADRVRVSQPFVSNMRAKLADQGVIESNTERIGADGRVYETANINADAKAKAASTPEEEIVPIAEPEPDTVEEDESAPYLAAFSDLAALIVSLDLDPRSIVGYAAKHRPAALEVMAERADELRAWVNKFGDAIDVAVDLRANAADVA